MKSLLETRHMCLEAILGVRVDLMPDDALWQKLTLWRTVQEDLIYA